MKTEDKSKEKVPSKKAKSQKTAETPVETEKAEVPASAEKKPKKTKKSAIPVKAKIPRIFRKQYTEKKLEKKIYKKIYVPEDKKLIESLMQEGKNKKDQTVYSIPKGTMLIKKDAKRLKKIGKEVQRQGTRIRWVPFAAVAVFFVVAVNLIVLTRNKIIKTIIVNTCESIFEAKCDIAYLNFDFIDSSFKIKGFEVANKKEPMKNLFSFDYFAVDFDLLQLLRSRFVADELALEGVGTNTDRKYSGDISAKLKAKLEKKKAKEAAKAQKGDSAFMKEIKAKSNAVINTVSSSVTGLFNEYNPQTVIENCYENLQITKVAATTQTEVQALIEKYKAKPDEIKVKIQEVEKIIQDVTSIDLNAIKSDPLKIKEVIDTINGAINETKALQAYIQGTIDDMEADTNKVNQLYKDIENAIDHDKKLAAEAVNKYTSLSLDDGLNFLSNTFDSVGYELLGKYYPYAQQGVTYLINNKNNNKNKEEKAKHKKVKSTPKERAKGRTVYYKSDSTPKFWIKRLAGSGANFSFTACDVTNDMDKTGKPATGNITLTFKNITHKADLIIDTRSYSKEALVTADYNCINLPLYYSADNFGNMPGLPSIQTNSDLGATLKIYEDEGFDINGRGILSDMNLTVAPFEPAYISTVYSNILGNIRTVQMEITAGYTLSKGINLKVSTDADKQIVSALKKELAAQLTEIKAQAEVAVMEKINELSGGATADLKSFDDIKAKIDEYANYADNMQKQMNDKLKEVENAYMNKTNEAIDSAKNAAKENIKNSATNLLKGFKF